MRSLLRTDHWLEVFDVARRNKLRTFLTALSVSWGIFMLVVLLGAGRGLEQGAQSRFKDDAINSIWLYRGKTSVAHKGLPIGRQVQFENDDYDALKKLEDVEYITARFYMWGEFSVSYKDKHSFFDIRSCHPEHRYLENTIIIAGRFLNDIDIKERRKVAIIGVDVKKALFGKSDPVGEYINIRGLLYRVVGVFKDDGAPGEMRKIYVPITTAQMAYAAGNNIHQLMFTIGDAGVEESKAIAKKAVATIAANQRFDPSDPKAIRVRNNVENFERINQVFDMIRLFIWIVGLGTIVAGIVGVSNIMLISVAERSKEFGVRKALGATPWSIVSMVLAESVVLTSLSGYCGLVAGVGMLELLAQVLPNNDFFQNPEVDFSVALSAVVLLIVCGGLAGFFPARRAATVNPVVALRDE